MWKRAYIEMFPHLKYGTFQQGKMWKHVYIAMFPHFENTLVLQISSIDSCCNLLISFYSFFNFNLKLYMDCYVILCQLMFASDFEQISRLTCTCVIFKLSILKCFRMMLYTLHHIIILRCLIRPKNG